MDTRYLGLTSNSHHYDVKTGLPEKITSQNLKIVDKIIKLPGTVSMRDLKSEYRQKQQQYGGRKSHVEVA